ncbi:hypothetical protein [Martelella soudanensis]|uniref:hypothetical protein n=1 Tax=unclassified Martelella TaxID=2629616 RepID=UPI0015DF1072|nr:MULTISPECIES: hypothetical protein [unclassified Martelella]
MELNRGMDAGMLAAVSSAVFYPVIFTYLDWPGGAVRMHTAVGDISYGGNSWTGVGNLGSISLPQEIIGSMAATEATYSLVASPAMINDYLDDNIKGRAGRSDFGCLTGRPGKSTTLVGAPVTLFFGSMDTLGMNVAPDDSGGVQTQINVGLATGPAAREKAYAFHSEEAQAAEYPGDTAGRLSVNAYAKAQKQLWPES